MSEHTYAVIMAGGRGERFWPLSTHARPKQFISLFGGKPLLKLAVDRLEGIAPPERILIVTREDLLDFTRETAPGIPPENILGEPCGRDTAAACALGTARVAQRDPDGVVCVLTADHLIGDLDVFRDTLHDGVALAAATPSMITIGMEPTHPATGFGYIQAGEPLDTNARCEFRRALRFVEKPDAETAALYFERGNYYWNSGMFVWSLKTFENALERHCPELLELYRRVSAARGDEETAETLRAIYPGLARISVDYAIMEKTETLAMAVGKFSWDDVGAWPAVAGHFRPDHHGNIVIGSSESLDAHNNIVVSEDRLTALIGVENLVVVHSDTATLICPKDRAQEVKDLLQRIERRPDADKYL